MKATKLVIAALAMCSTMVGCGDEASKRTSISCNSDTLHLCQFGESDVPMELSCSDGAVEVDSCTTTDLIATCTFYPTAGALHTVVLYVYPGSTFTRSLCEDRNDGLWTPVPQ